MRGFREEEQDSQQKRITIDDCGDYDDYEEEKEMFAESS